MAKYHKKQIEIEAIQQKGNNTQAVLDFLASIDGLELEWARYWVDKKQLELYINKTQHVVPDGYWIVSQFGIELKIYGPSDFELMHDGEDGEKTWIDHRYDEMKASQHKPKMCVKLLEFIAKPHKKKNRYYIDIQNDVHKIEVD